MIQARFIPRRTASVLLALAVPTMLIACGSSYSSRHQALLDEPTPELSTLYQRQVDMDNRWAVTTNHSWLMFNQDFQRAFYIDRPSRLTREPMPHH